MNVVFDALGTLFEPTPLRERLGEAPFEAWFERTLQSAASLTMLGEFFPFAQLARSTLATTCAVLGLDVDPDDVVAQLGRLPPAADARAALELLQESGGRAFLLTNGGRATGEELVRRAGLCELVERVFGVDEVGAYKPDPRPYRIVLDELGAEATLVAAHAWDVVGAVRAGMHGVWVSRHERTWPFPQETAPHGTAPDLVEAVRSAFTGTP
ncbi:MAG TPA: HAD-IA family hydrolase [Gaiellaceae bacterium]|nr:HAD-IA family hydrolase [Gaiellaceae bacterium]